MSWDDLKVEATYVEALAGQMLTDRHAQAFDASRITDAKTDVAKDLLRQQLLDPKVGSLSEIIDEQGGVTKALNALTTQEELASDLQSALAHAFVYVEGKAGRNTGGANDLWNAMAEDAWAGVKSSVRALSAHAGHVMLGRATQAIQYRKREPSTFIDAGAAW